MLTGEARLQGYRLAGEDFLADRIQDMLLPIKSPEGQALHNVILEEVLSMVGDDEETQKLFFRRIAHKLLATRKKKQNLLSKILAKSIFSVRRKT